MTSDKLKSLFADSPTRPAGYRQTLLINGEEYGFCWIPPGEFDMGSPKSETGRWANERLHHVTLTKGFWLLETPVTRRLYQSVVGTKPSWFRFSGSLATCLASKFDELDSFDELLTRSIEMVRSDLPVESVNYDGAMEFCRKLTKFMPNGLKAYIPTEAQWEYACRAERKRRIGMEIPSTSAR